ncbi:PDZ domain-containing protein [Streptacidiphilus sp. N1-3]|uniref:Tricorn protease homolog n=1 Tax=Streptacidiphilus alkalitolerans TaxID=3342712 RepID=A0ABV6XC24_9ACTN
MTHADGYFRFPHIHSDLVTFVAEDDIWLAPAGGGGGGAARAWRLTADQVPVSRPRFSPDGSLIAWASTLDGAPEIHVAPAEGGPARRLTYWGSDSTTLLGWTPEGEPLALSTVGRMSRAHPWAYALPLDGGPARQLPYGRIGGAALEPGGSRALLGTAGAREPAHWKRYRGGRAGKLWIGAEGAFERVHQGLDGNIDSPMWLSSGRIAFLSDHEGVGQVYSSRPDGTDLRSHSDLEFYARNGSTDGSRVVFHSAGDLWLLDDLADARPRRLEISLGGPRTARRPRPVTAAKHLGTVSPDAEGRGSLLEVRGTVHRVAHLDGPALALADTPGVRNRLPQPLPDGASVWVTDAGGEDGLEFSDGRRVAVGQLGRVEELAASPDGSVLAVANRDGAVLLVQDGEVRELDRSEAVHATGLAFSPDSAWLAWSHGADQNDRLRQIRLAHLADGRITEVTPVRFVDHSPAFSADGRYLGFLSIREFDPVYDEHVFDLSFPLGCRPYLALLADDLLSPFEPQPQGRALGRRKKDDPDEAGSVRATRVDTEGLAGRIVPFPVEAGRYESLRPAKDGFVWLNRPLVGQLGNARATQDTPAKRPALEYFSLATRRLEVLADALDRFAVSGDGTRLALVDGEELRIVPADRKPVKEDREDEVRVDLERIRVTVDPPAEWRQMFDETARLMRDNFWRIDLGGVDWEAVQRRYRPLIDRLGSHDDLVDLLWELQGELGTSHAYVQPAARRVGPARRQGLLGADLARDGDGSWRITRILPGESSAPQARSPLAAPGLGVRAGDALTAVNGRPVDPVTGPAPLLVGTAGKPVELTLAAADGEYAVVVVPLSDDQPLRYQDWVAGRRARVRELSGGRLGYLHLPDMMAPGWAQLHRDLHTEAALDGLVVDTRENRGGHTSQLVVEKLNRRIVKWQAVRDHRPAIRYPEDAPRGPLVAVADEFSGSDGDNINAAFQAFGLGPVVGVRTWGGVVGIDGHYRLVDGTGVTQPRFRTWFEGYGWGLENHGVDPDVEVVCTPQDWAAGRDPQLEEAVRIALAALEQTPAAAPPEIPPLP